MFLLHLPIDLFLINWGRVTHIYVSELTIIVSDNGLSPGRCQVIIWTSAGILLFRTLGTNLSEILSEIHKLSFRKIHFKMSSGKLRPSCLGLNVLNTRSYRCLAHSHCPNWWVVCQKHCRCQWQWHYLCMCWNCHTLKCHWRNSDFIVAYTGTPLEGL